MSRAQAKEVSSPLSLFPFIGVLLSTMGALLVVLIAVSRLARDSALRDVAAKRAAAQATVAAAANSSDAAEYQGKLEEVSTYSNRLQEVRSKTDKQFRDDQLRLAHVEQQMRSLENQLASLQQAAIELESQDKGHLDDRRQAEREVQRLQQLITETRERIDTAKSEVSTKKRSYAIIPYDGPNGTQRRPIYIECRGNAVVIQPEGIALTPNDFEPPLDAGNPLAAALRAASEQLTNGSGASRDKQHEPYPLILVRPDGIVAYYNVRAAITSWDADFGYEFVGQDWKLKFQPADPLLAQAEQHAIEQARLHRKALAAAAPRAYRSGGMAGSGGFSIGDDDDDDEVAAWAADRRAGQRGGSGTGGGGYGTGNGGSGTGGGRYGTGTGGYAGLGSGSATPEEATYPSQPIGAAMSSAAAGAGGGSGGRQGAAGGGSGTAGPLLAKEGEQGTGGSRSGGTGQGSATAANRGTNSSGASGGKQGGSNLSSGEPGNGSGGAPGTDGTSSSMAGGPSVVGNAGTDSRGGPGASGPGGASPHPPEGAASGGASMAGSASADGNGGAGGMGAGMSTPPRLDVHAMPQTITPQELAKARGANWALGGRAVAAVPVRRSIQIVIREDRMTVLPESSSADQQQDGKDVPLSGRTIENIDPVVAAVRHRVEEWGMAGNGLYWRPVLVMHVWPDGQKRAEEMAQLLKNSGIELRANTATQSAPANGPQQR